VPSRDHAISHFFAGECTERGSRVKALRGAAMNAPRTRALDSPPSPLLCCFQLGKNVSGKMGTGEYYTVWATSPVEEIA
jgi:hypothetical protein